MILKHTSKPLFTPAGAANVRIVLFAFLSVVLMIADHRLHALSYARNALSTLVYPLQYAAQLPGRVSETLRDSVASRRELLSRIERLRERELLASARLQKLTALELENQRLRRLLESSASIPQRVVIAELLMVDLEPYRHRILLNKGSIHGVRPGQPLLTEQGIVGQIVQVTPLTSLAILITDSNHALPVRIERTGLRTLVRGKGSLHQLELPHLPNDKDVREGDVLSTSGLGGRFPRGYPVARVTGVQLDAGQPFAHVTATPFAALDRIREVLLVIHDSLEAPEGPDDIATDTVSVPLVEALNAAEP